MIRDRSAMPALLALVLCAAAGAAEPEAAGSVIKAKGAVDVQRRDGSIIPAAGGTQLSAGDTVRNGLDGKTQIWLQDDTYIAVGSASSVRVDEYRAPGGENDASGRSVLSLLKGAMRGITGIIAKNNPKNFEVRTPAATMGVKGTDFSMVHCNNDCDARGRAAGGLLKKMGLGDSRGQLVKTAEKKPVPNGSYLRPSKGAVQLCNGAGCESLAAGKTNACLFAADKTTKPKVIPDCPVLFPDEDELEFDFTDEDLKLFRELRGVPREPPGSPS